MSGTASNVSVPKLHLLCRCQDQDYEVFTPAGINYPEVMSAPCSCVIQQKLRTHQEQTSLHLELPRLLTEGSCESTTERRAHPVHVSLSLLRASYGFQAQLPFLVLVLNLKIRFRTGERTAAQFMLFELNPIHFQSLLRMQTS